MDIKMVKKRLQNNIIYNSFINIVASMILTFATQIIAHPFLSRQYSAEGYGTILTVMGIVNALSVATGNTLNITRLLTNNDYEDNDISGDFNIILIGVISLISIIIYNAVYFFFDFNFLESTQVVILCSFIILRAYYIVSYKIKLDYTKILFVNVFGFLGYIIGIMLFYLTGVWIHIFIIGELFSLFYIIKTSSVVKEPFKTTKFFRATTARYSYLLSSTLVSNILVYMDRFLIFPFLGPGLVAVYSASSFLGKATKLIMSPVSSVLLSYYTREESITLKIFFKRVILFSFLGFIGYIIVIITGPFIIGLLYPDLVEQALPYYKLANLAAIISTVGGAIIPTLLRFADSRWQIIIQFSYLVVYFISAYFGMVNFGLIGFCFGLIVSNTFKVLLMIIIGTFSFK